MMGWPHTATFEERGFTIVDMERVPTLAAEVPFPCLVEPLAPKELESIAFQVEKPMARISWPPIDGKELENGDRVKFGDKPYELAQVQPDIYRVSDPFYTAFLCGGKE